MKTIVALFDTFAEAQDAVQDLEAEGIGKGEISVVTSGQHAATSVPQSGPVATTADATADEPASTGAGALIGAGLGILAGLAAVTIPGVGIVAAVGPIIAGGVVGAVAGGLVGSLVDAGVPEDEAEHYAEAVRAGGTLVTVRSNPTDADRVVRILNRHHPVDIRHRIQSGRGHALPRSNRDDLPDAAGRTTMGDAAAHMPKPNAMEAGDTGGVVPNSASSGLPNGEDQFAVGRDVPAHAGSQ